MANWRRTRKTGGAGNQSTRITTGPGGVTTSKSYKNGSKSNRVTVSTRTTSSGKHIQRTTRSIGGMRMVTQNTINKTPKTKSYKPKNGRVYKSKRIKFNKSRRKSNSSDVSAGIWLIIIVVFLILGLIS